MPTPFFIVDAFTNRRFSGNPAAICLLSEEHDADWMLAIAAEMNLSETAFVLRRGDSFNLRWFTPLTEVALCGHATLAAAHILWESHLLEYGIPIIFETLSGRLAAVKTGAWINLDFPTLAVKEAEPPKGLLQALNVEPIFFGFSRFDAFLQLESEAVVIALSPDFDALKKIDGIRGTVVTARSKSLEYDFVSRFFGPAVGINEDPVTGSAHCCLAPYWAEKLGRTDLAGYQASARGGLVRVSLLGERVQLAGQAVTVVKGELV